MNDQEINIAIAEACGLSEMGFMGDTLMHAGTGTFLEVPNYTTDLNAMHEAEESLQLDQWHFYWKRLDNGEYATTNRLKYLLHATARQRAEAFLRTIGRWKDEVK